MARATTLFAGAIAAAAALAQPAAAVPGVCAAGWSDAGGGVCTRSFAVTGLMQTITVPAGAGAITAQVSGAQGGPGFDDGYTPSPGGLGGRQTATFPVIPGEALSVIVGQAGLLHSGFAGGWGGGGAAASNYGGHGGGGSFVFDPDGLMVAAGGGGGGGYDYNAFASHGGYGDQKAPGGAGSGAAAAGDGGAATFLYDPTFNAPTHYPPGGGAGATPLAAGAGGHSLIPGSYAFGQVDGAPGTGPATMPDPAHPDQVDPYLGQGGASPKGTCCYYYGFGGGGGGGAYGGGSGSTIDADLEGGGGGGGSGFLTPLASSGTAATGVQADDGHVTLSYHIGSFLPPGVTSGPQPVSTIEGSPVAFTVTATNATAVLWESSTDGGASWAPVPGATSTTLAFTAALADDGTQYRAVLANANGKARTAAAPLAVSPAPSDTTPPTATLTGPDSPTATATLVYHLAFSEPVSGLAAADLSVTGSATGCQVGDPSGAGAAYDVPVTGCGNGTVVLTLHAGAVQDAAANPGPVADVAAAPVTIARAGPPPVDPPPVDPPPVTPPPVTQTPAIVRTGSAHATRRRGAVTVDAGRALACPAGPATCSATATLTARAGHHTSTIARASVRTAPGRRTAIRFTLSRSAAAALRHGSLRTTFSATARAGTISVRSTATFTLRRG